MYILLGYFNNSGIINCKVSIYLPGWQLKNVLMMYDFKLLFLTLPLEKSIIAMLQSLHLPAGHYVITIGRAFGAGGRELGRLLSAKLGIPYYDKELLGEAAAKAGMNVDLFARNDERAPGMLAGLPPLSLGYNALSWYNCPSGTSREAVYRAQSDFIRHIAVEQSCVIVGRTADYILRDLPGVFSIFLHAPEEVCVQRILARADCADADKARSIRRKTNKLRAEFYNFYTDRTWGDASTYHLTIDSSMMPMDDIADFVISTLCAFLKAQNIK